MMTGSVVSRHASLAVAFLLSGQPDLSIEFVVDTGFTDYLTLPPAAVTAMGLPFLYHMSAALADDSTVEIPVYLAAILWNGIPKEVRVFATGRRPLLGTALLERCKLEAHFVEGGPITIQEM